MNEEHISTVKMGYHDIYIKFVSKLNRSTKLKAPNF